MSKEKTRLTHLAKSNGCGGKLSPLDLKEILGNLKIKGHPNLLVDHSSSDDAAVYQISKDKALVTTVDVIAPVCDDPFVFGQVAAANALSDVYAMGGQPLVGLNICAFPMDVVSKETLSQILEGGLDKVHEAGAVIAGGHSIKNDELKFGVSVVGEVHPKKIWRNNTPQKGDSLILTKALGTGIAVFAFKKGDLDEKPFQSILKNMILLNKYAAEALFRFDVHAATDVTGFGLAGHGLEMATGSGMGLRIYFNELPHYKESLKFMKQGVRTGGTVTNELSTHDKIEGREKIDPYEKDLLFDPQTSGGLLVALKKSEAKDAVKALQDAGCTEAAIIGEVFESKKPVLVIEG